MKMFVTALPAGGTGHAESVQIIYDPEKVTYEKLLSVFWHNIDPTDFISYYLNKFFIVKE
jgi:peptide methionine sulfoxide reductase MsrA